MKKHILLILVIVIINSLNNFAYAIDISSASNISNCYSTGSVSGDENIGGFCGKVFYADIINCHSVGYTSGSQSIGGFIGLNEGSCSCCFWNTQTSHRNNAVGTGSNSGISGLNNSQYRNEISFSHCFVFPSIWVMSETMPILSNISIPTLTEWAAILFIGLLAGVGGWFVWRKMV